MRVSINHIVNAIFGSCFKSRNSGGNFTNVQQLREIMPALLEGYLSEAEMPNSLLLLSPPPKHNSSLFELDLEYARKALESKDEERFLQAARDADLSFPFAVKSFESIIGLQISESKTPKLYVLMRRVMTDAGLSTYAAKNHYKRERPFMMNNQKTCTPDQENILYKVGSFPSGHAAVGWAWSLVLIKLFPGKEKEILKRGHDFGESRIVCNVHWYSDVKMGRAMGQAAVECLWGNSGFLADWNDVKKELQGILDSNSE
ncbi:phosphatase PAP2 family protein [Flavobacterium sp. HBTb2-11-1]|uniref:acid phosphatase n=1 Tax=Flavobacterium sp. HBTb2-11-1 TaxID=2692212 RepID=UPI00136EBD72|nr:phosphatase PAP2 family protein [Flavobacterium sp. HBTb2-11-1]MXO03777.1 phosphatase PAP2 family protein [Flavobacterium sp. HBTb2-11-1]